MKNLFKTLTATVGAVTILMSGIDADAQMRSGRNGGRDNNRVVRLSELAKSNETLQRAEVRKAQSDLTAALNATGKRLATDKLNLIATFIAVTGKDISRLSEALMTNDAQKKVVGEKVLELLEIHANRGDLEITVTKDANGRTIGQPESALMLEFNGERYDITDALLGEILTMSDSMSYENAAKFLDDVKAERQNTTAIESYKRAAMKLNSTKVDKIEDLVKLCGKKSVGLKLI